MNAGDATSGAGKALQLLSLLPTRPFEFADRVRAIIEVRSEKFMPSRAHYRCTPYQEMLEGIQATLACRVDEHLGDPALDRLGVQVTATSSELLTLGAPFRPAHNADQRLARVAWAVVRALRPATVLETGVAYGVTSRYILAALEANKNGVLHSIDLPPLSRHGEQYLGAMVPHALKQRWRLHRGTSRRILPGLLPEIDPIDLFIHDSLHTRGNILAELHAVRPCLADRSIVIADDIESNTAFAEWVAEFRPAYHAVVRESTKNSLMGMAVFVPGAAP